MGTSLSLLHSHIYHDIVLLLLILLVPSITSSNITHSFPHSSSRLIDSTAFNSLSHTCSPYLTVFISHWITSFVLWSFSLINSFVRLLTLLLLYSIISFQMSVDRTIEELSGTLAQLGQLVGHINGQINGITSRINVTLDNFDRVRLPSSYFFNSLCLRVQSIWFVLSKLREMLQAITNIATDAGSVTGQVGDTVSQVRD